MRQLKSTGGYFELELPHSDNSHYHPSAIRLNTARCAFEYVLRARKYSKVYLPFYTCDVMMEPIRKLGLEIDFYHIDRLLDPVFNKQLSADEVFVYTNYWGVKQKTVERLACGMENLLVDNSQAFFAAPVAGTDTIYSARKFFGLPDGAYLYTQAELDEELPKDISCGRISHLVKRLELGAEAGYADFCANDASLVGQSVKAMSALTERLVEGIDYPKAMQRRIANFKQLHRSLGKTNLLEILDDAAAQAPMVYPYWSNKAGLRDMLIEQKIFVARYWPNVPQWCAGRDCLELDLSENLIPLPIDHRYDGEDMARIIKTIEQCMSKYDL